MIRLVSVLLFVPMEVFACAIFTFTRDGQVYMGNNEDFVKPGVIWFVPGRGSRYGRVNVGFDNDFAQGSMNEKGLSFDAAALSPVPWEEDPDKESPRNLLEKIMNECATVREALGYFETYNCRHLADGQFMFADATGDSAVVAWLPKTGLSVVRRSGESQVVTNTRLESSSYRCSRFTRAMQVLSGADASVSDMAEVLDAIHQRGPGAFTSYSTVYDLTQRKVFVYNLANFDEVVEFDLMTELAKGKRRTVELAKEFEESPSLDEIRSGEQRSMWDTRVTLDDSILQRYVGQYSPAPGVTAEVELDGEGGLRVKNPDQSDAVLFPESETLFRIAPDRGQVRFELDANGGIRGLTLLKQADVFAARIDVP